MRRFLPVLFLPLVAPTATVRIANSVLREGRTRWIEGVFLLGVYALLAVFV